MAPERKWVWKYFIGPPWNPSTSSYNRQQSQTSRTLCLRCFDHDVEEIMRNEKEEYEKSQRTGPRCRSREEIQEAMVRLPESGPDRKWITSRVSTMTTHLCHCPYQESRVKERAQRGTRTGIIQRPSGRSVVIQQPEHSGARTNGSASGSVSVDVEMQERGSSPLPTSSGSGPVSESTSPLDPSPSPTVPRLTSTVDRLRNQNSTHLPSSLSAIIGNSSVTPQDSASQLRIYLINRLGAQKVQELLLSIPHASTDISSGRSPRNERASASNWTEMNQQQFEDDLLDFFVSGNLSFDFVDNPEFRRFSWRYHPCGSMLPSSKILSGRILQNRLQRLQQEARDRE